MYCIFKIGFLFGGFLEEIMVNDFYVKVMVGFSGDVEVNVVEIDYIECEVGRVVCVYRLVLMGVELFIRVLGLCCYIILL